MAAENAQIWQAISGALERRESLVVATVVRDSGSVPRRAGTKMLVFSDRRTSGTVGGGMFELLVIRDALDALKAGRSETRRYQFAPRGSGPDAFGAVCGGEVEVFLEVLMPRDRLLIVGGGHCGRALAAAAAALEFDILVADDREEFVQRDAFPNTVALFHASPDFANLPEPDAQTFVVLVSKGFVSDEAALRRVIGSQAAYIGMMGSLKKRDTVFASLIESGIPAERLACVHAPVGLDIGADSPAEIAISILAEIIEQRAARRIGTSQASSDPQIVSS